MSEKGLLYLVCGERDYKENVVPARSTGPMCNCKNECFKKVGPELQFHIITSFNNLGSKERQDQYLNSLIIASDPKRQGAQGRGGRFEKENPGKRQTTYKYHVPTGNAVQCFLHHDIKLIEEVFIL